jgi:pimeloyl-ACP methyl ester carboxylesterase
MLWVLLLVPITLVITVFVIGMSWYIAHTTLRPPRRRTTGEPGDWDLPYEQVSFESDGCSLRGWLVPAKQGGRCPAVVLTHGWGASAEQMLPVAAILHKAGICSLLFNVRGHGDSDPAEYVSISRYADDIHRAVDDLASRREVDPHRIGLVGHSMGAAASLLEASKDERIRAVVSSAGFADFNDLTTQLLKWRRLPGFPFRRLIHYFWMSRTGLTMLEVNPAEAIKRVRCPVLLLHGDLDEVVPPEQLQKLRSQAPSANLRSVLVPARDHGDIFRSEVFERELVRFLHEVLVQRHESVSGEG